MVEIRSKIRNATAPGPPAQRHEPAGFVGGAMFHYICSPLPVQAHQQAPSEIRAQKFVLVDENGMVRGVFGFRTDGSPDIQVELPKRRFWSGGVASPRWLGVVGRSILPDLKPPKTHLPSGSR
jgi:hypothetical protein